MNNNINSFRKHAKTNTFVILKTFTIIVIYLKLLYWSGQNVRTRRHLNEYNNNTHSEVKPGDQDCHGV